MDKFLPMHLEYQPEKFLQNPRRRVGPDPLPRALSNEGHYPGGYS